MQVSVAPLFDVTVMIAVPAATPVMAPVSGSTVAQLASLEDQMMVKSLERVVQETLRRV